MMKEDSSAGDTVAVLSVSHDPLKRQAFIKDQRVRTIQMLAKKTEQPPLDLGSEQIKGLVDQLDRLLTWLEIDLQMTPKIKQATVIDKGLKLIYDTPKYHFPKVFQDRARTLHERWEEENWGANEVLEEEAVESSDSGDDGLPAPKRRKPSSANDTSEFDGLATIRIPPANHPIWGEDGIMHGVARKTGRRKGLIFDPRFAHQKRNFKVYGSNGFKSGDWFPYQIVALFRGVHGSSMAGISGNREEGAYSIVVSGMYDDLDTDNGDTLFYSGSGSHENTNKTVAASSTNGTMALHESLRTNRPVRVLRSASGKSRWAPIVGLRYDGLYEVVDVRYPLNIKGGMYEQFKLQRREGQPPISVGSRPTAAEVRDFEAVQKNY